MTDNPLGFAATLTTQSGTASSISLAEPTARMRTDVGRLPRTVKILLENIARTADAETQPKRTFDFLQSIISM